MLWLKTSGPLGEDDPRAPPPRSRGSPGVSTSTEASGSLALQRADRRGEVPGPAVREVVAIDRRDDDVREPHLLRGLRETQRLERVRRLLRPPRVDVAVAAGAGARVAEDLERRRAASPALGDVRAARLLADRVQTRAVDERAHLEVARVGARRAHLHPLRATRPLSDGQRPAQLRRSRRDRQPIRELLVDGLGPEAGAVLAGSSSNASSKTSSSAATSSGRTSSTADRPSELARDRRERLRRRGRRR